MCMPCSSMHGPAWPGQRLTARGSDALNRSPLTLRSLLCTHHYQQTCQSIAVASRLQAGAEVRHASSRTGRLTAAGSTLRSQQDAAGSDTSVQLNLQDEQHYQPDHQPDQQPQQSPGPAPVQGEASLTCRRCYQSFLASGNHSSACSFHPAMYTGGEVAKAIGFVRESSSPEHQLGAVVGRTGLMRFWDCCGAADTSAPGCVHGFHLCFDDDVNEAHGWRE